MAKLQTRNIIPEKFLSLTAPKEKIAFLLQYAVLAPSTHNSQPWQFRINNNSCEIIIDNERPIVYADPKGRDLYISLGCMIENLCLASRYFGVFKEIKYIFEKSTVARIYFDFSNPIIDPSLLPLLAAITKRVTARGIFEKDSIDSANWNVFQDLAISDGLSRHFLKEAQGIDRIAELTREGLVMAYNDPKFREEMSQWFNNSISKRPFGIPGYSVRMPFLLSFIFPWLVRHFNIGKRLGLLNYLSIKSAPAAVIITAKENNQTYWLESGRFAERFVLEANTRGYKTSFFTAAIEMGDLYKDIQKLLKTDEIPQFIIIFGKLNYEQKPNLRYSAEDKIIK